MLDLLNNCDEELVLSVFLNHISFSHLHFVRTLYELDIGILRYHIESSYIKYT